MDFRQETRKTVYWIRHCISGADSELAKSTSGEASGITSDAAPARLVICENDYHSVRHHLLQDDGNERAAFLLLGMKRGGGVSEMYVKSVLLPGDEDYRYQHRTLVEPSSEYVLKTFAAFVASGASGYLHAHSHPFSDNACFSHVDDAYLPGTRRSLVNYLVGSGFKEQPAFLRLVWGRSEAGFTMEHFPNNSKPMPVREIKVIGKHGMRVVRCWDEPTGEAAKSSRREELFRRQVAFLGEEGQQAIGRTRLAVCGVGGLGSFIVSCARGLGFRDIALFDPDIVEESNLNRFQGASRDDVGKAKVEVIAEATHRFDPSIRVKPLKCNVQDDRAHRHLLDADMIINCLDNNNARMEMQLLAARYMKPMIDLGSGIRLQSGTRTVKDMGGQVILYYPGGPCLMCQGLDARHIISAQMLEVRRAAGYIEGTEETPAAVVTINAVIAGLGLHTALEYITGFAEAPQYLKYNCMNQSIETFRFVRRPDCPICGEDGIVGDGDDASAGKAGGFRSPLPPGRLEPDSRGNTDQSGEIRDVEYYQIQAWSISSHPRRIPDEKNISGNEHGL